jgi:purine-nucleoside phosphorylase
MTEAPDQAARVAGELARRLGVDHHDVLVVLGSGLSGVAEALDPGAPSAPLDTLPHFPPLSAPGHRAEARSVAIGTRRVLVLEGRSHLYEGHSMSDVLLPLRMGLATGCHTVLLTAAVGSLRDDLAAGTLVTVADQINMTGHTPLVGPQFVDMVGAYDPELRQLALQTPGIVLDQRPTVYAQVLGPQFETPAEAAMLRTLGADVVGMSMAFETIAARHAGRKVLGVAMVTNMSAGSDGDADEIVRVAAKSVDSVAAIVRHVVVSLS